MAQPAPITLDSPLYVGRHRTTIGLLHRAQALFLRLEGAASEAAPLPLAPSSAPSVFSAQPEPSISIPPEVDPVDAMLIDDDDPGADTTVEEERNADPVPVPVPIPDPAALESANPWDHPPARPIYRWNPPASIADLDALQACLPAGFRIPESLVALYLVHNGDQEDALVTTLPDGEWLDLRGVVARKRMWDGLARCAAMEESPRGPVRWYPTWIPFSESSSGHHLCFDIWRGIVLDMSGARRGSRIEAELDLLQYLEKLAEDITLRKRVWNQEVFNFTFG